MPLMTVSARARIGSVAFSSDGTRIVSGLKDCSVRVWDAWTGVELKELKGHIKTVGSVAFSSDGTWIVSGSRDSTVRVWDAWTGVELKELKGHTKTVRSVAFSSDGTRIVSGSEDCSVRVWDVMSTGISSDVFIGDARFAWRLADSNWIISSQEENPLMWVPRELNLITPPKILIISRSGCSTVDFSQSMIGVDWIHCYTP